VRVLITGSRNWRDPLDVLQRLGDLLDDGYYGPFTLVHGACPEGVDQVADRWAREHEPYGVTIEPHPADWDGPKGKGAGFARNTQMVAAGADLCLAFIARCAKPDCRRPGVHGSHGATDCAHKAAAAGTPTDEYLRWGDR
jgi:hypothetical protein